MKEKMNDLKQLPREELKDVKGGIPYQMPELLELDGSTSSCTVGRHCDNGYNNTGNCSTGLTCSSGFHGSEPDPNPTPY